MIALALKALGLMRVSEHERIEGNLQQIIGRHIDASADLFEERNDWEAKFKRAATDLAAQAEEIAGLVEAVVQYRDDLRRPPAPDSVERRLEWVNALIAKATDRSGAEEWEGELTSEEKAMVDRAWDRHVAAGPQCEIPPEGWACTRGAGHEGPCAAVPSHGRDYLKRSRDRKAGKKS